MKGKAMEILVANKMSYRDLDFVLLILKLKTLLGTDRRFERKFIEPVFIVLYGTWGLDAPKAIWSLHKCGFLRSKLYGW